MAIVQALLAALARSAGKLLNTAFGWATSMLFGRVPEERQIYLSAMAFGSVAWLVVAVGVLAPAFGVWLLSFAPLPAWVDRNLVRWLMLVAAALLPLLVGLLATRMRDASEPSRAPGSFARTLLKGYPYTLGLALTLLLMTLFAPALKLRALLRRWSTEHVPMMVDAPDYETVVAEIEAALRRAGWSVHRERASWMLRLPTRILTLLAGAAIERLVAEELAVLRSDRLEVTLHPADLVVSGREREVARARAVLAEQLAFSPAHLTWTKEAGEIEDRLEALRREQMVQGERFHLEEGLRRLEAIGRDLECLEIAYEEWEVLFRQKLLVERELLRLGMERAVQGAGDFDRASEGAAARLARPGVLRSEPLQKARGVRRKSPGLLTVVTGAALALLRLRLRRPAAGAAPSRVAGRR